MDPLKRELYMRARTILECREKSCVCWALLEALTELGIFYYNTPESGLTLEELLQDIFPEFFALDDCIQWHLDGNSDEISVYAAFPRAKGSARYWWDSDNLEPRLRILNCILNSH